MRTPSTRGVRVVLDARALQRPDAAPVTATYLAGLLGALDEHPLDGESLALLLASDLDDPSARYPNLRVASRRLLPPTRLLRHAATAVDPFLLRGASIGASWRAERSGASGAVYHAVGAALPIGSGIPVVATLLDLAPWELPELYARGGPARFGHRLRVRLAREADAVLVGTKAVARLARRLLRLRPDRIRVVPLAARPAFRAAAADAMTGGERELALRSRSRRERERLGLPARYLVHAGRFDARHDLGTLLAALATLGAHERPSELPPSGEWPPRICLVGATPDDRAAVARAAAREGVGELLAYAPELTPDRMAALVAGARAAIIPVRSDAAGLAAIEATAAGVPVVASAVGALPEIVGSAGILVEPGDAERLAAALTTIWTDDAVHASLRDAALERATTAPRTWADVAAETRRVWADVAGDGRLI